MPADWKRSKCSLLTDIIIYIENPEEYTKLTYMN